MADSVRSAFVALFVAAGLACVQGNDAEGNVRRALEQAGMQEVSVEVDRDRRYVHLKGSVRSLSDRRRAEEIAAASLSGTDRIVNELQVTNLDGSEQP